MGPCAACGCLTDRRGSDRPAGERVDQSNQLGSPPFVLGTAPCGPTRCRSLLHNCPIILCIVGDSFTAKWSELSMNIRAGKLPARTLNRRVLCEIIRNVVESGMP